MRRRELIRVRALGLPLGVTIVGNQSGHPSLKRPVWVRTCAATVW
jgi:hypothetical protein